MNRLFSSRRPVGLALAALLMLGAAQAAAQQVPLEPRPARKGIKRSVTIDSSPQQAAIYLDDTKYGIVGYTPYKGILVDGDYKLILKLPGFQVNESVLRVKRGVTPVMVVLQREVLPGTISVLAASDPNLNGAVLSVDGKSQGTVPGEVKLPAGRHLVEISKDGFVPYSQWLEVAEGQLLTLAPVLKPVTVAQKPKGSLLIDANVPGAEVIVDGRTLPELTPLVVDSLDEGPHLIEVLKAPAAPWKETVFVRAGERLRVMAQLRMPDASAVTPTPGQPQQPVVPSGPATAGSLKVSANVVGAEVWLDGKLAGKTPLELHDVEVGAHEVEVRAPNHESARGSIQIQAGQLVTIEMTLPSIDLTRGTLRVVSSVPEAVVFIDGARIGLVPVEKQLPVGKHFVLVTREGFSTFEKEVTIAPGEVLDLTATLLSAGRLRVVASENGAEVVIDGRPAGLTPLDLPSFEAGEHVVTVRMAGFHEYRTTVRIAGGQTAVVNANLQKLQTALTWEQLQVRQRGLAPYSALPMALGNFTVDLSGGYPYWLQARATVGVSDADQFGWDLGLGARSYTNNWELFLTGRLRLLHSGPFSLGAFAAAGGGDGTRGSNSMFLQGGGLASLMLGDRVVITGRAYLDIWSDRLCPAPDSDDAGQSICSRDPGSYSEKERERIEEMIDSSDARELRDNRDIGTRFYLSLVVEAGIWQNLSLFGIFEGAPGQGERAAHSELFNNRMPGQDAIYNARLGVTLKY